MSDDYVSIDDLAVRRAFRACLETEVPWERVVHLLWLGYVWRDAQRHREESRRSVVQSLFGIRNLYATPFYGSDYYGSVYVQ